MGLELNKYSDMGKNVQKIIGASELTDCVVPKVDQSTDIHFVFSGEVYWL